MNATSDKEKPKKKKAKYLTFRQLLSRVTKHDACPSLLRTAAQSGWLTDEEFLTRLSDKEQDFVREVYRKHPTAKKVDPADMSTVLPEQVGSLVDGVKIAGGKVRLTANGRTVQVDGVLYLTMKKRHPDANIFLSNRDPDNDPVIFSEKTTVALLPVQK